MKNQNKFLNKRIAISIFAAFLLGGCASHNNTTYIKPPDLKLENVLRGISKKDKISLIIKKCIKQIELAKYDEATKIISEGLRLSPDNGHLHFLNALSYHMQSLNGNKKMLDLAQTGYLTALKFDDTNYWASYLLGNVYFKKKEYKKAQNHFAQGLLYDNKNPYLLRGLAVTSYYSNDIALNTWAAKRAYEVDPDNIASLKNLIFAQAAAGKTKIAKETLKKFNKVLNDKKQRDDNNYMRELSFDIVSNRVNDWKNYHEIAQLNIFGSDDDRSTDSFDHDSSSDSSDDDSLSDSSDDDTDDDSSDNTASNNDTENNTNKKEKVNLPKMTLVDVVIIKTEEVKSQAKGINLLEGLKTTMSGTIYNRTKTATSDSESSTVQFDLTGITYNFNIFNDGANKAEVLARPSLLAVENKKSRFHSGSKLHVQLDSSNGDDSMDEVDIGINLEITPKFYGNDTIQITVHAQRSSLETLSEEVGFTAFTQTSQTSVDATAVLKFGETLILSGLTVNSNDNTKSGVPLLQDIPGLQYLFSRAVQEEVRKSILILLTPRKPRYYNEILTHGERANLEDEANKKETYYTRLLINKERISTTNSDAILSHLGNNQLYRQFRKGDLKLDDWNNADTFMGSLKRMAGFLYY